MTKEQLFINDFEIDLQNQNLTRKIQLLNIGEISALKSSFSYTIKIPKTQNNQAFFNMLGVVGNTSRKPYENLKACYLVDGLILFENGYVRISSVVADGININIINGLKGLELAIKDKKLGDLDLSILDQDFNCLNAVENSANNTYGYIHPIMNGSSKYDSLTNNRSVNVPCVFLHTILRLIINQAGFGIGGDFYIDSDFRNEVTTPEEGFNSEPTYSLETRGVSNGSIELDGIVSAPFDVTYKVDLIADVQYPFDYVIEDGRYVNVVIGDGLYNVKALFFGSKRTQTKLTYIFKLNGVTLKELYSSIDDDNNVSPTPSFFRANFKNGDVISLDVRVQTEDDSLDLDLSWAPRFERANSASVQLNGADCLPKNMLQSDFLKDIINRHLVILKEVGNTIKIEKLEDILNDFENSVDWSKFLAGNKKESYTSKYAQENRFEFANTTNSFSTGKLYVNNYNADETKEVFRSKFDVPKLDSWGFINTGFMDIWSDNPIEETDIGISVNIQKQTPRVYSLLRNYATPIPIVTKFFDEVNFAAIDGSFTHCVDAKVLFDTYLDGYESFNRMLNDYKEVTFYFNLSAIILTQLDITQLIFLKQTGKYYLLKSITYTPNKLSKVELIEIK